MNSHIFSCCVNLGASISKGIYTKLPQKSESKEESSEAGVYSTDIGSEEDLKIITENPLQRAAFCLHRALHLSAGNFDADVGTSDENHKVIPSPKEGSADVDMDCYETALVSLAYVKLQLKDHDGALELCKVALGPTSASGGGDDKGSCSFKSLRLREMAESYCREATTGLS